MTSIERARIMARLKQMQEVASGDRDAMHRVSTDE